MSHHSSNKSYLATIQFSVDNEWPIRSWFCTCISGWCDVGYCAHAAALLWHLSASEAAQHNKLHSLSAGHFSASNDDSVQLSDVDDSDDSLESSEAVGTKNTDDSKDKVEDKSLRHLLLLSFLANKER